MSYIIKIYNNHPFYLKLQKKNGTFSYFLISALVQINTTRESFDTYFQHRTNKCKYEQKL